MLFFSMRLSPFHLLLAFFLSSCFPSGALSLLIVSKSSLSGDKSLFGLMMAPIACYA